MTGLIYRSITGATQMVGSSSDALLTRAGPLAGEPGHPSREREAMLAALNGVMGDLLLDTANPLAMPMRLRHEGQALALDKPRWRSACPARQPSRWC